MTLARTGFGAAPPGARRPRGDAVASAAAAWVSRWVRGGLLVAALAAAGGAAAQVIVRDDRGVEHRFERTPQRVVTLLPSLTETVCALGACSRLVGTDRYSNFPASVVALPKLGGLDDALLERIVALKPDVVLAASSTRAVDRLEKLGVPVLAFESDRHEQVRASLQRVGVLLGASAQADATWALIEAEFDRAAAAVPLALRGRSVYFEADSAPYAAGASSFVGQTLTRLKLDNIAPATMGPFPKLNPEFVVRSQPQVIMAARRNADEMPKRPGWAALQALQKGRICAFDEARYELMIRPGPRMGQAALAMAECLVGLPQ